MANRLSLTVSTLLIALLGLALAGCTPAPSDGRPAPGPAPAAEPSSTSATSESWIEEDLKWFDSELDISWTSVNQFAIQGATQEVSGTVLMQGDWAATGARFLYVDAGGEHPTCVVLNEYTKLGWPQAWGQYVPDPDSDQPAVKLPPAVTISRFRGTVRVLEVAGGREQAFALEARIE